MSCYVLTICNLDQALYIEGRIAQGNIAFWGKPSLFHEESNKYITSLDDNIYECKNKRICLYGITNNVI